MKRIHVFVLCCLMIACFCSGCFHAKDHTVIAQEIADTMIDAIRSRDAEAIEIMFSNSIQEELQNLPEQAEMFVDYFRGEIVSYSVGHVSATSHNYFGTHDDYVDACCDVITNESKYQFFFRACFRNTDDSDKLGLQSVSVIEDLELHGSSAGKIVVDIDPSYPEGIIFVPYE